MESVLTGSTLHREEERVSLRQWWRAGFPAAVGQRSGEQGFRQRRDSGWTSIFSIICSRIASRENLGASYPAAVGDTEVFGARLNSKPPTFGVRTAVSVLQVWLHLFSVISMSNVPSIALDLFFSRSIACRTAARNSVCVDFLFHIWIQLIRIYEGLRPNLFLHPIKERSQLVLTVYFRNVIPVIHGVIYCDFSLPPLYKSVYASGIN